MPEESEQPRSPGLSDDTPCFREADKDTTRRITLKMMKSDPVRAEAYRNDFFRLYGEYP